MEYQVSDVQWERENWWVFKLGVSDGRVKWGRGLKGLADEEVESGAFPGEGDVKAGIDVFFGENEEAKASASGEDKVGEVEGIFFGEDAPRGHEDRAAPAAQGSTVHEGEESVLDLAGQEVFVAVTPEVIAPHEAFAPHEGHLVEGDIAHREEAHGLGGEDLVLADGPVNAGVGDEGGEVVVAAPKLVGMEEGQFAEEAIPDIEYVVAAVVDDAGSDGEVLGAFRSGREVEGIVFVFGQEFGPGEALEVQFQAREQRAVEPSQDAFLGQEVIGVDERGEFFGGFGADAVVEEGKALVTGPPEEEPIVVIGIDGMIGPDAVLALQGDKGPDEDLAEAVGGIALGVEDAEGIEAKFPAGFGGKGDGGVEEELGAAVVDGVVDHLVDVPGHKVVPLGLAGSGKGQDHDGGQEEGEECAAKRKPLVHETKLGELGEKKG